MKRENRNPMANRKNSLVSEVVIAIEIGVDRIMMIIQCQVLGKGKRWYTCQFRLIERSILS